MSSSTTASAVPSPLGAPAVHGARLALLAAVLAAGAFVCMDAMIKLISPRYGALQLSFFRFASGSVYALALWAWFRSPLPQGRAWRLHGLRSVLLLLSLVGYFHALTVLPLAQTWPSATWRPSPCPCSPCGCCTNGPRRGSGPRCRSAWPAWA